MNLIVTYEPVEESEEPEESAILNAMTRLYIEYLEEEATTFEAEKRDLEFG